MMVRATAPINPLLSSGKKKKTKAEKVAAETYKKAVENVEIPISSTGFLSNQGFDRLIKAAIKTIKKKNLIKESPKEPEENGGEDVTDPQANPKEVELLKKKTLSVDLKIKDFSIKEVEKKVTPREGKG